MDHCNTCQYFQQASKRTDDMGECHRHAPSPSGAKHLTFKGSAWPIVESNIGWCGDYVQSAAHIKALRDREINAELRKNKILKDAEKKIENLQTIIASIRGSRL